MTGPVARLGPATALCGGCYQPAAMFHSADDVPVEPGSAARLVAGNLTPTGPSASPKNGRKQKFRRNLL
jgi:hypothetical protein